MTFEAKPRATNSVVAILTVESPKAFVMEVFALLALPVKLPVNVVAETELKPARVVVEPPKSTWFVPIVTDLLTKSSFATVPFAILTELILLEAMLVVPDSFIVTSPDIATEAAILFTSPTMIWPFVKAEPTVDTPADKAL